MQRVIRTVTEAGGFLLGRKTLMQHQLIDVLRLTIDSVLLGTGKRLFPEGGHASPMDLIDSQVTTTGAVFATYAVRLEHVA